MSSPVNPPRPHMDCARLYPSEVSQSASSASASAATEAELTALVEREGDLGMKQVIFVFLEFLL